MSIGGLLAKLAEMQAKGPSVQCERCQLYYLEKQHDECPHCTHLSDKELYYFLVEQEQNREGSKKIGYGFALAAILTAVLMFFIS
ncbi:hypothetical protein NBRC116188_11650 [Oceaniserpentilla sp. 4NH20-0058]|uniref:hypothetical protein n=1 Tax=Oceaniserpentilla sp. 4NH20-0058 TaxID=3127660 RepID=UPI003108FD0B